MPYQDQIKLGPRMKDCLDKDDERTGFIALAPFNNFIIEKLQENFNQYGYQTIIFESKEAIFKNQTSIDYQENICLGISVQETGINNTWKYSLHYNTSTFEENDDDDIEIPSTDGIKFISYKNQAIKSNLDSYVENGFMTIQNWIDNIIYKNITQNNDSSIQPSVTSQRVPDHSDDDLPGVMEDNFATFTILPIIIVYLRFLNQILLEKQSKIREQMRIMGLSDYSLYLSWIIYYGIIFTIISLLSAFIMKTSIFPNSSYTLIFVWYWIYCMNILFMALLISSFFTDAKLGIIAGMVLYLGLYILNFVVQSDKEMEIGKRTTYSLIPQISVPQGARVFALIENSDDGISWSDIDFEVDRFTVLRSIYTMLISLAVFIILFLYLDQVIPNEFGNKKHPLFCLKKCLKKQQNDKKISTSQKLANFTYQEKQKNLIKGEQVRGQQYVDNYAQFQTGNIASDEQNEDFDLENIDEINDNIEPVEAIFKQKEQQNEALLLKKLTKIYSNGKKAVDNLNLSIYKDQISCLLGHNGAGKTSVIQMLTGMNSITKGSASVFGLNIEDEMEKVRHIMGVCPQHDILFGNLTVKEHLEVFAVLKGMKDQNLIKQEIEQLLSDVDLEFKKDVYSKNLSGGQKRRLSVAIAFIGGSKLIYLDEPTSGCDTSVRRHIWEMLRKYKQDRIIILTTHFMDEADYLGDRISIIGNGKLICSGSSNYLKTKFGVGYNLTIVKEKNTVESQSIINLVTQYIKSAKIISDVSQELSFQLKMNEIDNFENLFNQLDNQKNQLKIINYGISITTMEEVFLKVAEMQVEDVKMGASLIKKNSIKYGSQIKQTNSSQMLQKNLQILEDFDLQKNKIQGSAKIFHVHFWALVKKRWQFFKRDKKSIFCEIVIPVLVLIFGVWALTVETFKEDPTLLLEPSIYSQKQPVYIAENSTITTQNSQQIQDILSQFDQNHYEFENLGQVSVQDFDQVNFDNKKEARRGAFYFQQISNINIDYLLEIETLNKDACPLYVNQMNQAIMRQQTNNPSLQIQLLVDPFEHTERFKSLQQSNKGIGAAFTFSMLLSFVPASIITFIVKERAENIKHQQVVSGVSLNSYWFSSYFLDFVKFLFPLCTMCILMILAFDLEYYTDEADVFVVIIILFILYGFSIIPWTYAFSFLFHKPGNAQVASFFVHYLIGSLLPLIFWILRVFVESARDAAIACQWIFRIFPSFSLGNALINISSRETFKVMDEDIDEVQSPFHINIAGADIITMILMAFISLGAISIQEYWKSRGTLDKLLQNDSSFPQYDKNQLYDDDVQTEKDIIEKSMQDDYAIRLRNVRKVYKYQNNFLTAVDSVSFGVDQGECFTLLGINGAGKTTLFKILTGDLVSTSGEVHINSFDISTQMQQARNFIGYCPQFDALLENLTAKEHLQLYAAIKGIPEDIRDQMVEMKIQEMDLTKFRDVVAGTYSGGNKRKLSVAIAMIGNPPVVLLDEPSTGMDPKSRRFMWDVVSKISAQQKKSSIILTTHSMEEAEALSTKMTIMVKGNLKCIGSIQHIKSKFGQGYEIEIKVNLPTNQDKIQLIQQSGFKQLDLEYTISQNEELEGILQKLNFTEYLELIQPGRQGEVLFNQLNSLHGLKLGNLMEFLMVKKNLQTIGQFLESNFQQYSIIENFGAYSRFKISDDVAIGKIFGDLQKHKQELNIASYSVNQTSIESIFNDFAEDKIKTEDFNKGGKFYQQQQLDKQQQIQQEQEIDNILQQKGIKIELNKKQENLATQHSENP